MGKYDLGTFWSKSGLAASEMCDPDNVESSAWFAQSGEVEDASARLASDAQKEAAGIPIVSSTNNDKEKTAPKPEDAPEKPAPKPEDAPEKPAPKPEDKPKPKTDEEKPKPPPKTGRKSASERREARAEMVKVGPLIEDERVVMVWGAVLLAVV